MEKIFKSSIVKFFHSLWVDRSGLAAIEFALIAPVMIVILFGAIEVNIALSADRKVTQTTSTIADLVAQDDIITSDEMSDIFKAASAIIQPHDTDPLRMRVSSVVMDDKGKVTVDWSEAENMGARAEGSSVAVPAGVLQPNSSIVMAETTYAYVSSIGVSMHTPINLKDTFYLRPRRAQKVTGP